MPPHAVPNAVPTTPAAMVVTKTCEFGPPPGSVPVRPMMMM